MQRFTGTLPPRPRVALIANDALGNFVVATSVARGLRAHWTPRGLDLFGGPRTAALEARSALFDQRFDAFAPPTGLDAYDFVLNLERASPHSMLAGRLAALGAVVAGPCEDPSTGLVLPAAPGPAGALWRDEAWTDEAFPSRHPELATGFIAEVFARAAGIPQLQGGTWPGGIFPYEVPSAPVIGATPRAVLCTGASLREKLWRPEAWVTVAQALALRWGEVPALVGAPPRTGGYVGDEADEALVAANVVVDQRGRWSLPELVTVLRQAREVVTLDNGVMHLAAAVGTRTTALFRREVVRLWGPPGVRAVWDDRGVAAIPVERVIDDRPLGRA